MEEKKPLSDEDDTRVSELVKRLFSLAYISTFFIVLCTLMVTMPETMDSLLAEEVQLDTVPTINPADTLVIDGVHVASGLIVADGYEIVRTRCMRCHKGKTITQNRMERDGWEEAIRWMQETQGLEDLGEHESIILDYLAKNYAPESKGRRPNLENIEWYVLEE
jgi:hypothetical protein